MIQPTSNYLGYSRTNALGDNSSSKHSAPVANSSSENVPTDQLSSSNSDALRSALSRTPEVRPDVVERGKSLAARGDYPPLEIINRLTEMIISSQDLSEQQ